MATTKPNQAHHGRAKDSPHGTSQSHPPPLLPQPELDPALGPSLHSQDFCSFQQYLDDQESENPTALAS